MGYTDSRKKFQEIKYDMGNASLEDVETILNYYNQSSHTINGTTYHGNVNPLEAAFLNARYKQLTGKDHPTFISEQVKVLDKLIKFGDEIIVNGKPSIYQRLKNNITGEGFGISIILNSKDNYIEKFHKIEFDMDKANLEDVKDILDHYDQDSVLINGIQYHFRPNPLVAASLNFRYKQLTGKEHPIFLKVQKEILEEIIANNQNMRVNDNPTVYELLLNNLTGNGCGIEIADRNHILYKLYEITENIQTARLEDISALLNYFSGKPVLINGIAHHPYNDPIVAAKLNTRYRELTGNNHPVFTEQAPKVINGLIEDKDMLIRTGAFNQSYFSTLEQIKQEIENSLARTNDEVCERQR